ncbi:MAG: hypothetical protein K9I59_04365 [Chlorobium sp.]|uniref:hypothetical protein n=1 Tax=Chlorobium sp. TaxID=1095 RepID=UPI0025C2D3BF|nr:hypothetical protein [Chlorobium sp.]MCF8216016.1 hypothetical protein [Chlorobium sp.]MCF8270917.1 hypothetical protein [Chlorobium sp.]MCF8287291.1 hypothetical protein [Chlorobium sp.]MCF8291666.1 hypothetical protein [Chlorobium sp.]MCF8384925.1 hypothetical protein [Chlorobium sp.]
MIDEFSGFSAGRNIVVRNVSFDRRFLDSELKCSKRTIDGDCCCSLLFSMRICQDPPNHKPQTLVSHAGLPKSGAFQRSLVNAGARAHLWQSMIIRISRLRDVMVLTLKSGDFVWSVQLNPAMWR